MNKFEDDRRKKTGNFKMLFILNIFNIHHSISDNPPHSNQLNFVLFQVSLTQRPDALCTTRRMTYDDWASLMIVKVNRLNVRSRKNALRYLGCIKKKQNYFGSPVVCAFSFNKLNTFSKHPINFTVTSRSQAFYVCMC